MRNTLDSPAEFQPFFPVFNYANRDTVTKDEKVENKKNEYMVVADDQLVGMLSETASALNYPIFEAVNGQQALDIIESQGQSCEVLLTDWQMPVVNGHDLINAVIMKKLKVKKILICSAMPDSCIKLPESLLVSNIPHCFLSKPFTETELIEAVNKLKCR